MKSSSTNYQIKKKNSEEPEPLRKNNACYSEFYGKLNDIETIKVYYPRTSIEASQQKDEGAYKTPSYVEMKKYMDYLKQMGFKFTYTEDVMVGDEPCVVMDIIVKENSIMANKFLLNCFRYCFESGMQDIVYSFLWMASRKSKINLFSRLCMAHFCSTAHFNTNHAFINKSAYIKIMSDTEVENLIFKNNNNVTCLEILPKGKSTKYDHYNQEKAFLSKEWKEKTTFFNFAKQYENVA